MKLLVGLGNPGPKYETTRHNAGFLILDFLAEDHGISWEGSRFDGEFGKGSIDAVPVLLFKPMTFMNLSGRAVQKIAAFYKIAEKDIAVLHDDVDLASGAVKARVGGGHGGHNGIRSIIEESGLSGFYRIKLGVGRPGTTEKGVSDWVLGQFSDAELLSLQNEMLDAAKLRLKPWLKDQV